MTRARGAIETTPYPGLASATLKNCVSSSPALHYACYRTWPVQPCYMRPCCTLLATTYHGFRLLPLLWVVHLLHQLHVTQKYDFMKPLQREGLEVPSVSAKDLTQRVSKQREKKSPAFFLCVMSFHSWDLCTFPSSRWQRTAYLAFFSHTAYGSTQTPSIFCGLHSLSLSSTVLLCSVLLNELLFQSKKVLIWDI